MDYKTALDTLIQYNAWRRDDHIPNMYEMPNPRDIGIAVDVAIAVLDNIVNYQNERTHIDCDGHIL